MGFTVVPLAQKARTKTLIADSDLNLGNYDLIATDVRGDTAKFSEFVGGVGNFSNVLGSGNLDIEGTGNIKGLTTFQNAVQVNGALHVEGSINNVNIADNGEITTAQGVNGADFNGAAITSTKFNGATIPSNGNITAGTYNGATITSTKFNGATIDASGNITGVKGTFSGAVSCTKLTESNKTITVTPTNNYGSGGLDFTTRAFEKFGCILPPLQNKVYTGSVRFYSESGGNVNYFTSLTASQQTTLTVGSGSFVNIPLNNAKVLYIQCYGVFLCDFTLT